MSTFGDLYRQAKVLRDERSAVNMQQKLPDPKISREVDELTRIMNGLKLAYVNAGGSKAE